MLMNTVNERIKIKLSTKSKLFSEMLNFASSLLSLYSFSLLFFFFLMRWLQQDLPIQWSISVTEWHLACEGTVLSELFVSGKSAG